MEHDLLYQPKVRLLSRRIVLFLGMATGENPPARKRSWILSGK